MSGVATTSRMRDTQDTYMHSMERVDFVVVIIILAAAALAMVVLFNLSNINITVPAEDAQHVCDLLIECGIRAIWNFAPKHLDVPPDILVHNENMAASLALLSKHLSYKIKNEE